MFDLVLASSSEYRKRQLASLGFQFQTIAPDIEECPQAKEQPSALVLRLATLKARIVAQKLPQSVVIGSDQVGSCNGELLLKPIVFQKALSMLLSFRGQTVIFYSAVAVIAPQRKVLCDVITTVVQFRDFDRSEAMNYLQIDQPLDCAGAFKSEAHGSLLFRSVQSEDPSALIGLPLIRTAEFLRDVGINPLESDVAKIHQNTPGLEL